MSPMRHMREKNTHILSTFPKAMLARIVDEVPGTTVTPIAADSPLPDGTSGEVLLIPPWDPGNLDQLLGCGVRWLHTIGTGVDRLPLAKLENISLTCSRGASAVPISEWILAAMLAWEKQLPQTWLGAAPEKTEYPRLGTLHGRTLGLLGLGAIGEATARHALGFGMRVVALRRTDKPSRISGVEIVHELGDLLAVANHIVLALPLTPASRHIINTDSLAAIPADAGVHLINISRGGLVDQEALRPALEDGRVACATLDVTDPEPPPAGHWLYAHPCVRVSAHVSWSAPNSFEFLLDTFIANLKRYQMGERLEGLVNLKEGY